jgi:Spy/CpxP family protein refolding chaperone
MNMKRLFLSIAILACMSLTATVGAQESKREGRKDIAKELNLTAEQQQKMEAAKTDMVAKMKELKDNTSLSKEEKMSKMKELREQQQTAFNNILTPEQQAKLKEMRKAPARDGKFAFHGKRGGDFKLDQASKDKLKSLKDDYVKQKQAVELSRIAPEAQKQKISELRENYKKEKRQIITDARKAKENQPV